MAGLVPAVKFVKKYSGGFIQSIMTIRTFWLYKSVKTNLKLQI